MFGWGVFWCRFDWCRFGTDCCFFSQGISSFGSRSRKRTDSKKSWFPVSKVRVRSRSFGVIFFFLDWLQAPSELTQYKFISSLSCFWFMSKELGVDPPLSAPPKKKRERVDCQKGTDVKTLRSTLTFQSELTHFGIDSLFGIDSNGKPQTRWFEFKSFCYSLREVM